MSKAITNFIGSLTTDLARPCNFDVTIVPNVNLLSKLFSLNIKGIFSLFTLAQSRSLSLRCEQAELPSRTFALVDQKTYGPVEFFPVQNSYDKVNFIFMCSDTMSEKAFFDGWMELICLSSPILGPLDNLLALGGFSTGGVNFDFEYKSTYETPITVTQYSVTGVPTYRCILNGAFPVSVNQLPLAWREQNSYNRLVVTFAYRYFTVIPF